MRPLGHTLLALVLLVQGFVVAASERTLDAAAEQAAPCHGDPAPDRDDCCDSNCPDMASCMLGHIAAAPAAAGMTAPGASCATTPLVAMTSSAAPPFLLRPPIALHA